MLEYDNCFAAVIAWIGLLVEKKSVQTFAHTPPHRRLRVQHLVEGCFDMKTRELIHRPCDW